MDKAFFGNIGKKIKTLAFVLFVIGILISFVLAIISFLSFVALEEVGMGLLSAFVTLLIGFLSSWLSNLLLYGFGQMIDSTEIIKRKMNYKDEQV